VSEWNELQKVKRNQNKIIDSDVELFTNRVKKVLDDVNTSITVMIQDYMQTNKLKAVNFEMLLERKAQLDRILIDTGYFNAVDDLILKETDILDTVQRQYKVFDYDVKFLDPSQIALKELQKNSVVTFQDIGRKATNQIYQGLYTTLLSDVPFDEAVSGLRQVIEKTDLQKYAGTYANTAYMEFIRTAHATTAEQTGWKRFQFVGPIDGKVSHEYCFLYIGKILTKAEIDKTDNNQLPNPFITGGGYNCRHLWQNVPDDYKLTKEEQSGIDRQLKIVEEQKKEKKVA